MESTLEVVCCEIIYHVTFELHFCSDLKFLYLSANLTAANSRFFCPTCTCPEELRSTIYLLEESHRRLYSKKEAESCAFCSGLMFEMTFDGKRIPKSCPDKKHGEKIGENLLDGLVDNSHLWIDLVHMELRLTDRTEMFFQEEAVLNDKVKELDASILEQCGISYKSYKSKTKTGKLEWPSLSCDQKLLILDHLQDVRRFITDESKAENYLLCAELLRQCLAFLRCPRHYEDHLECPHELQTLEPLESTIKRMSKTDCKG